LLRRTLQRDFPVRQPKKDLYNYASFESLARKLNDFGVSSGVDNEMKN
jgi:hypothetical protein